MDLLPVSFERGETGKPFSVSLAQGTREIELVTNILIFMKRLAMFYKNLCGGEGFFATLAWPHATLVFL